MIGVFLRSGLRLAGMSTPPALPDPWLRGPVEGIPALLQPVAHALIAAGEDIERAVAGLEPILRGAEQALEDVARRVPVALACGPGWGARCWQNIRKRD